jgi:hypothetical protein
MYIEIAYIKRRLKNTFMIVKILIILPKYVIIYNTDTQHYNVHHYIVLHLTLICICNSCNYLQRISDF